VTVDRTSLVAYPLEYEDMAKSIAEKLVKEIISITNRHIIKHNFQVGGPDYELVWEFVFRKIGFADTIFINDLSYTEYGNILWPGIEKVAGEKLSIKQFLKKQKLSLQNFNLSELDKLTEKLVLFKLISAKEIRVFRNDIQCISDALYKVPFLGKSNDIDHHKILIKADAWETDFSEFDIVSSLYPLIPEHLFNQIGSYDGQSINDRIKVIQAWGNGISAFFDQDPALVNESLGLYTSRSEPFGSKRNQIYRFENKRASFGLFEINERFESRESKDRVVVTAFISPRILTLSEQQSLEAIKTKDQSYYQGVTEGWSILVTGARTNNMIISPGIKSRNELVSKLTDEFWAESGQITFKFTDGALLTRK
jgi:hypothetical protein